MSHPRKRAERWAQADLLAPLGPCGGASGALAGVPVALQPVPPQAATPARSAQAELWCALHLPALCFEAAWHDGLAPAGVARAVIDGDSRVQRLLALDPRAPAPGVQPGMTLVAALAACPALQVRPRDARRERLRLVALAEAALAFTPRVSLEPPDELLLELQGSLRLFGGVEVLAQQLLDTAAQLGLSARLAWAPTPRAALAGARGARGFRALHEAQLVGQLAPLPVTVLREPAPVVARLTSMGVNTLGELLRLPRAGLAQRFGPALPLLLDRLVGRAREPRRAFVPAVRFRGRCEPLYELSSHAALLRHLEPLLTELEQFLRRRQCALTALRIRLRHRVPHAATRFELRLAAPEFAAQRFAALLAEHFAHLVLPAPVRRIELRSGELLPLAGAAATPATSAAAAANGSDSLWRPGEQGGTVGRETPALLERLRARLGHAAVHGLCLIPDHRPEASWRIAEPALPFTATAATGTRTGTAAVTAADAAATAAAQELRARQRRRPLWLLATPRRLGALPAGWRLLDGPERIETGWWDGHDVARDYYLLRDAAGAELWAFRDRQAPHDWFLHGVFG